MGIRSNGMRYFKPQHICLGLILAIILSAPVHAQDMNDFEKALKKAQKSPEKKKNKEALNAAYLNIQSQYVQSLSNTLSESENLNPELTEGIKNYFGLKRSYLEVYPSAPSAEGEATLNLLLEQLTHDYYEKGEQLLQRNDKEAYIIATAFLGVVKTIDPNYKNVIELYAKASSNSKYDILITYDMGNFPEHERAMQEVLNDINMKINNYNTEKKTFYLRRESGKDYQLEYLITFRYLDFGQLSKRNSSQNYQRTVNGQVKRARVIMEQFSKDTKANGVFTIENTVTGETIEKDLFNINFTSRASNARIEGDQEAIDIRLLRELMRMRGSEFDVEQEALDNFKRQMFSLLERHLRYDYPLGNL